MARSASLPTLPVVHWMTRSLSISAPSRPQARRVAASRPLRNGWRYAGNDRLFPGRSHCRCGVVDEGGHAEKLERLGNPGALPGLRIPCAVRHHPDRAILACAIDAGIEDRADAAAARRVEAVQQRHVPPDHALNRTVRLEDQAQPPAV